VVQAPALTLQTSQPPLQDLSQHTLSTQKPLEHVVDALQAFPFLSLHAPVEEHVFRPVQVSVSSAPFTVLHVPSVPIRPQLLHVPVQPASQQYPSLQKPLVHSWQPTTRQCPAGAASVLQVLPFPRLGWHVASAAQWKLGTQSASPAQIDGQSPLTPSQRKPPHEGATPGAPSARFVQSPGVASQTSQPPAQALLQQYPLTQKPLAHVEASVQVRPFLLLHWPNTSQVLVPVQESRSSALMIAPQAPGFPAVSQAWHGPQEMLSQQTPSTQNAVSQAEGQKQALPRP
jgi:hypothetical protein